MSAERQSMSENVNELAVALAAAQAEMDFARKDSTNPHFKSSYADLTSVWEVCRAVLPKNGLAVVQTMEHVEGKVAVRTTLMHKSGQWISGVCVLPAVKQDPQAYGSAITYARRYSLSSIVGVVADDDDGESAMDRGRQQEPRKTPPKPQQDDTAVKVKEFYDLSKIKGCKSQSEALAKAGDFFRRTITKPSDMTADELAEIISAIKEAA